MASKLNVLLTSPASSTLGNRGLGRWATLPTQLYALLTFERLYTTMEAGRGDGKTSHTDERHSMQFCNADQHMSSPDSLHCHVDMSH